MFNLVLLQRMVVLMMKISNLHYILPQNHYTLDTVFTNEGEYYGAYEFFGSAVASGQVVSLNDPPYLFRWYVNDLFVGDGEYLLYRFPATNNYEGTEYECMFRS